MLRVSLWGLMVHEENKIGQSVFALEFIRWRRKPRWLPTAKSKLNRVPERKRQPLAEREELKRLYNNYHLQVRSLMQYFRQEVQRNEQISSADHFVLTPQQEEEEFQRSLHENEKWNAKIAAERETRLEKERQERALLIQQRLEAARIREENHLERIEEIVKREKESAKTFITLENLEKAINFALANPVDYNFSIDLKGNIYRGRKTVPVETGNKKSEDNPHAEAVQN